MEAQIIQGWLNVALQQGASVAVLLLVIHTYRKDVTKQREDDRADREKERLEHAKQQEALTAVFRATVQELVETHKSSLEKVLQKAETSERLGEERYKMVLEQTLNRKKAS